MPGYSVDRFPELSVEDREEYTCSICQEIFKTPVTTTCCLQMFCEDCINEWLKHNTTCPYDRRQLTRSGLTKPPRLVMNMLNRFKIQCDYWAKGCREVVKLELLPQHTVNCRWNAWKPMAKQFQHSSATDHEEQETREMINKMSVIVDKLTPQTADGLTKQILSFKIDTEDQLKRVLNLVYDRAVRTEPAVCHIYANLFKQMSKLKVMVNREEWAEEVKLLKLLLHKCQKEFEADIYSSIPDLKLRQEEIERCTDPELKNHKREALDEDMSRARGRCLGNIVLIGELYKLNMLKANIMVQCVDNLIKDADDESLECLCALFRTAGGQLEKEASSSQQQTMLLDSFFAKLQNIADQKDPRVKDTSARVRHMLRDITDMRRNGWKD